MITSGHAAEIERLAIVAETSAARLNRRADVTSAQYYRAQAARLLGEPQSAVPLLNEVVGRALEAGDHGAAGRALRVLCEVHRENGNGDRAAESAVEAIRSFGRAGDPAAASGMLLELAILLKDRRRVEEAARLIEHAINRREYYSTGDAGSRRAPAWAHENYGAILKRLGRLDEAVQEHPISARHFTEVSHAQGRAYSARNLGDLARRQGRHAEAMQFYEESRRLFKRIGDARGQAQATASIALAAFHLHSWARLIGAAARWAVIGVPLRDKTETLRRFGTLQRERQRGERPARPGATALPAVVERYLRELPD